MIQVTTSTEASGHRENEDAYVVKSHLSGPDRSLCFQEDGQGGQSGGTDAARIACRTPAAAALGRSTRDSPDPGSAVAMPRAADRAVRDGPVAGFTSPISFLITGDFVVGPRAAMAPS